MALLEIRDLTVAFRGTTVVDGVSLAIEPGEALGLVGESGSGKSVTAHSIGRLLPEPPASYPAGAIHLDGVDVLKASKSELRRLRGAVVSYVFQEPGPALHPTRAIGRQILEAARRRPGFSGGLDEAVARLREMGIPEPARRARQYPHELSGGMQQRVMLAMALASAPKLLVADEPTTALDPTVQAQILDLLARARRERGMAILLITHNIAVVHQVADRIAVAYAGQIVESAPAAEILRSPRHPYTRALIASVPRLDRSAGRLAGIQGNAPDPLHWPTGCRFHPRCPIARPSCATTPPRLETVAPGAQVRCPWWNDPPPQPVS